MNSWRAGLVKTPIGAYTSVDLVLRYNSNRTYTYGLSNATSVNGAESLASVKEIKSYNLPLVKIRMFIVSTNSKQLASFLLHTCYNKQKFRKGR